PTGAVAPAGFFERLVALAREHGILVVHDNAYSETTYDGYVAPSFLATAGAAPPSAATRTRSRPTGGSRRTRTRASSRPCSSRASPPCAARASRSPR